MTRKALPSYRLHKATGQAVVTLSGHDHYLGRHGTPESEAEYNRLVALWLASGRQPLRLATVETDRTINELALAYFEWAEGYYVKNGRKTTAVSFHRCTLDGIRKLFGREGVNDFDVVKLEALRQHWVGQKECRHTINSRTALIVRMFRWGVTKKWVSTLAWQELKALRGLTKGRSAAVESRKVGPVGMDVVEATAACLRANYRALVFLQLYTGMRPGEALMIRPVDIDVSGDVWLYRPESHKTEHHGQSRVVCLGPQAQELLRPWLEKVSSPRSLVFPAPRDDSQPISISSYNIAIRRAAKKAKVAHWHPNMLRHAFATLVRKEFGLDAVQVSLGHAKASTSEIYAERDLAKAADVARRFG